MLRQEGYGMIYSLLTTYTFGENSMNHAVLSLKWLCKYTDLVNVKPCEHACVSHQAMGI